MEQQVYRPFGVAVITFLLAAAGVAALVSALSLQGAGGTAATASLFEIVLGLAMIVLAFGMWTLRSWAWLGTLMVAGISALVSLIMLYAAPGIFSVWLGLVLSAIIVLHLLQGDVRETFNRSGTEA